MKITEQMKQKIIDLSNEGKTVTIIELTMGVSRSTIHKILSPEKYNKSREKQNHPFYTKMKTFQGKCPVNEALFNLEELIEHIGPNPICYITGQPIDIKNKSSYNFDHYIPKCKGGDNSLNNLKICTAKSNMMKLSMTFEEMIDECRKILAHQDSSVSI